MAKLLMYESRQVRLGSITSSGSPEGSPATASPAGRLVAKNSHATSLVAQIRAFLEQVDPDTGYIED
jgi:hypothetical protein